MRRIIVIFLCLCQLANGCKSQRVNEGGLYQRPGWWDRRMDRLEDWNTHHGYPLDKTKAVTKTVVGCTLVAVGTVAGVVAYLVLQSELNKLSDPKVPTGG